jgi:hypothetical protein
MGERSWTRAGCTNGTIMHISINRSCVRERTHVHAYTQSYNTPRQRQNGRKATHRPFASYGQQQAVPSPSLPPLLHRETGRWPLTMAAASASSCFSRVLRAPACVCVVWLIGWLVGWSRSDPAHNVQTHEHTYTPTLPPLVNAHRGGRWRPRT